MSLRGYFPDDGPFLRTSRQHRQVRGLFTIGDILSHDQATVKGTMLEKFPEKLQWLREQRGLSQRQLAAQLDIAKSHVNQLESGKRKPGTELTFKIADFFGVTVDVLVRDELELDDG